MMKIGQMQPQQKDSGFMVGVEKQSWHNHLFEFQPLALTKSLQLRGNKLVKV